MENITREKNRRDEDHDDIGLGAILPSSNDDASDTQRLIYSCPVDHFGTSVYVKGWRNKKSKFNPLLIVHDVGENIGLYRKTAQDLCDRGFSVYGFDLRGHGRSGRRLGHIPRFSVLVKDLLQVAAWVRHRENALAPVIVGQGIGANVALQFQLAHPRLAAALVLCSPSMAFLEPIGSLHRILIKTLAELTPTFRLPAGLCPRLSEPHAQLEGDFKSRIMEALSPGLQHRITAAFANEVLKSVHRSEAAFLDINCPTLVFVPEADTVYDYSPLRVLAAHHPAANAIQLCDLPGCGHHTLNDGAPAKAFMLDQLTAWLTHLHEARAQHTTQAALAAKPKEMEEVLSQ